MASVTRFRAHFSTDSGCFGCGGDIEQDDRIGYVDDEIHCEDCCDEAEAEEQDEIDGSGWLKK